MAEGYVLAIKPSARRASAAAGAWVNRRGPTRTFDSKDLAREWARDCASPDAPVWVQDAVPWDDGPADGYLVSGRRRARGRSDPPGDQLDLPTAVAPVDP